MASEGFFVAEHVQAALRNALGALNRAMPELEGRAALPERCASIIKVMLNNAQAFDAHCTQNIEWIGGSLVSQLQNLKVPTHWTDEATAQFLSNAERLFAMLFRFIKELQFSIPGELGFELQDVLAYANRALHNMSDEAREVISYANYVMPAQIIKQILHSEEIKSFMDFKAKSQSAEEMKRRWDREIAEKSKVISEFSDKLRDLTTDYNFVGLQHGFGKIYQEKMAERDSARLVMLGLGFLALVPLLSQIALFFLNPDFFAKRLAELKYVAPALLATEVILIYFFRIALQNANSIRVQLLQLKLRMTLCQFIQSYADYSSGIKQKDPSSLDRFENIVFSPIAPDENNLPSTLDGIEQLGKLIQAVKTR